MHSCRCECFRLIASEGGRVSSMQKHAQNFAARVLTQIHFYLIKFKTHMELQRDSELELPARKRHICFK